EFDVLIIGGGATGCGCALDAVSRGLRTALVEKFDFASGTSSRSTKLIHGGVRYLQKAVFNLDIEQYRMVKEALSERANLLQIAPHLSYPLPIMLPIYHLWQLPYFWAGIKMYDLVSGTQILKPSFYLSKSRALEYFPMLQKDALKGALVYYDGQHEDARMCLSIGLTAAKLGASIANYCEVVEILKSTDPTTNKEVVSGARVLDRTTGKEFAIKANERYRALFGHHPAEGESSESKDCRPSAGIHITLPDYYSPERMGLLDPATADGRVIFFLPWQNCTIAGTTDTPCELTDNPHPTEDDVKFILKEIKHYLSPDIDIRRGDVLSAWAGIRPLVTDPNKSDTQSIARNHIIEVSDSRMVTIAGGKWTTYRQMSEETIDKVIEVANLQAKGPCKTKGLLLDGAYHWGPNLFIRLVQEYGVEPSVAQHLANVYGDKSLERWPVVGKRLHPNYPYLESEVRWATREYACRAVDILARRTRLAFANVHAAVEALPRVVQIMGEELGWSETKRQEELAHCKRFLRFEMGYNLKLQERLQHPINLSSDEIADLMSKFRKMDADNKGFITLNDLERYF
uniref:Glycerol-3-phosphate dehydrogenase n=1 Tax=Macrostomum lignano TaxID=282301 RepID=A0A1I8JIS2_9PLAT